MTTFNSSGDTGNNQGDNPSQGATFQQQQDNGGQPNSNTGDGGNNSENVDVSKLVKRVEDSQSFIETLKSERQADQQRIQDLESKLQNTPTVDQIMEQLDQRQGASNDNLDTQDLVNKAVEQVQANLSQSKIAEQEQSNFTKVQSVLAKNFGDDIDSKVTELAAENGLTLSQVAEMAKKSPKATLKLLGITEQAPAPGSIPQGSVNTAAFQGTNNEPPKMRSIASANTDKERIEVTKAAFARAGLQF